MTSLAQTRAIHALRRQIEGMDEDAYRGLLKTKFRVASSKELNGGQAAHLIDDLKRRVNQPAGRSAATTASGKYAPVLQALWLAGWNLGIVRSKDDAALIKFVERQTGLSHTKFLNDPAEARKAVEGLKIWLARDGGVVWPAEGLSSIDTKRAVIAAIGKRMIACGAFTPFLRDGVYRDSDFEAFGYGRTRDRLPSGFFDYQPEHFDQLTRMMGAMLRAHLAKKAKAA